MSEGGSARDLSDRALAVMVRLLPSRRSEWGRAMRAELASLDDVRARRRYTLGCVRAVLSDRTAMRTVALHVVELAFGAVALAFAISINGVDWCGSRRSCSSWLSESSRGPDVDPGRWGRSPIIHRLGASAPRAMWYSARTSCRRLRRSLPPRRRTARSERRVDVLRRPESVPRDCPVGHGRAHGGPTADAAVDGSGHGRWAGGMVGSDAARGERPRAP